MAFSINPILSYPIRVRLLGAESVGKTQLSLILSSIFGGVFIAEYARDCWPLVRTWTDLSLQTSFILKGQVARDLSTLHHNKLYIQDTTTLTTLTYIGLTPPITGTPNAYTMSQAVECSKIPYHLTLLLSPDAPYVEDGIRGDARNQRFELTDMNIKLLNLEGGSYHIIEGDWGDRSKRSCELLYEVLDKNQQRG